MIIIFLCFVGKIVIKPKTAFPATAAFLGGKSLTLQGFDLFFKTSQTHQLFQLSFRQKQLLLSWSFPGQCISETSGFLIGCSGGRLLLSPLLLFYMKFIPKHFPASSLWLSLPSIMQALMLLQYCHCRCCESSKNED